MEKLIKPVDYAQELGISRQAVYAKVKRGILRSKSVDGKLYIAIDQPDNLPKENEADQAQEPHNKKSTKVSQTQDRLDYETLLQAKDETISVLKGTVKDLKKSNRQMTTTLRGEIDLLKEAFHEMRSMYVTQIDYIQHSDLKVANSPIETTAVEVNEDEWISLKKFFKKNKISKPKEQKEITKKLKKAYKKGDIRIISKEGSIKLNKAEDFRDILE